MSNQNFNGILKDKNILLIIGGGIAAYKSLDLIRRLKEKGAILDVVCTEAAKSFVTKFSIEALLGKPSFSDLFQKNDQYDVNHIRLARKADLIIFAPITASRMAKLAQGIAEDLAGAIYLAAKTKILFCPAMNPTMWQHPTTKRNKIQLEKDKVIFQGPEYGEMAESNEAGLGRMSEVQNIISAAENIFRENNRLQKLKGKHFIVTAGPTQESLDPIRYLTNHSSGKQGYAIAKKLAEYGAKVSLISGPVHLPPPPNLTCTIVHSSDEMLLAVQKALPADAAIFTAAVSDWKFENYHSQKLKKTDFGEKITLKMVKTPDILKIIAKSENRPQLVIGFAAETENGATYAKEKLKEKNADAILYNDVGSKKVKNGLEISIMGGDYNEITLFSHQEQLVWPLATKEEIAKKIILYCIEKLDEV